MSNEAVETVLQYELSRGDAILATAGPLLRHLLENDGNSLFSDEILARVRGMLTSIASQLLHAFDVEGDASHSADEVEQRREALVEHFVAQPALLRHAHALAIEWQLTERLQARMAIDPTLPPLLQALIASNEADVSAKAMKLLAAQARFGQQQRRMELPLAELPGDLFHASILTLRAFVESADDDQAHAAETKLRDAYDESVSRLGLIARLVMGMGGGALAALSVDHAGVAMFLSALATGSGQDRDLVALATNDKQLARLALSLRAAGLKADGVEQQFSYLHPQITLPEGFEGLRADDAAGLLASTAPAIAE